jgi:hypothetical protein
MLISDFLNSLLDRIQNRSIRKYWVGLAIAFLAVIFLNGVSLAPSLHYQRLSENPFIMRTDIAPDNYWQENLLLPSLAFFTRLTTPLAFTILCFVSVLAGFALFAGLAVSRWGITPAFIFSTLLFTSPLTTILLSWLGTPDGATFLLTIPFLFTSSATAMFAFAVLGSVNHIATPIAAAEILFLRWCARDGIRLRHLAAGILGGAAGYAMTRAFLTFLHIQAWSRFDNYLGRDVPSWIEMMAKNLSLTLFSFFNVHWVIVIAMLMMFFKMDKRFYLALVGIMGFNLVIGYFSNDSTRNFSLISWGLLLEGLIHSYRLATAKGESFRRSFLQVLAGIGVISVFFPRYYSWDGNIYCSSFFDVIQRLRWIILGHE